MSTYAESFDRLYACTSFVGDEIQLVSDVPPAAATNSVSGFQFNLDFNPASLQASSIIEAGYFANNGVIGLTIATINNIAGTITLIADAVATPEDPGAGDPLVNIAFSALACRQFADSFRE